MYEFIIALSLLTTLLGVFFAYVLVSDQRKVADHQPWTGVYVAIQPTDDDDVSRAVDWTADLVVCDLDGKPLRRCRAPNQWDEASIHRWLAYAVPEYMLLDGVDVYIGGKWVGSTEC